MREVMSRDEFGRYILENLPEGYSLNDFVKEGDVYTATIIEGSKEDGKTSKYSMFSIFRPRPKIIDMYIKMAISELDELDDIIND